MAREKGQRPDSAEATDVKEGLSAKETVKLEKKNMRLAARDRVREWLKNLDDVNLKADIVLLIGSGQRSVRGGVIRSINNVLREAFIAADDGLTEMDIFKQFKIGRPEMTSKVRIFLRTPVVADRVWVVFDEKTEIYTIAAIGENPPEGWEGYVPANENVL